MTNPVQMKVLETLSDSELSPRFVESGDFFADFIQKNSRPKLVVGGTLTGQSFSVLATKMVDDVTKKHVCIESTYQVIGPRKVLGKVKERLFKFFYSGTFFENED